MSDYSLKNTEVSLGNLKQFLSRMPKNEKELLKEDIKESIYDNMDTSNYTDKEIDNIVRYMIVHFSGHGGHYISLDWDDNWVSVLYKEDSDEIIKHIIEYLDGVSFYVSDRVIYSDSDYESDYEPDSSFGSIFSSTHKTDVLLSISISVVALGFFAFKYFF